LHVNPDFKIYLSWKKPKQLSNYHYQRFLYRAIHFVNNIDWFEVHEDSAQLLKSSKVLCPDGSPKRKEGHFVLNPQSKVRTPSKKHTEIPEQVSDKIGEHNLELYFQARPDILPFDHIEGIDRQLPVGVFTGSVGKEKYVFPGGSADIDLIVFRDKGELIIIELKNPANCTVGAISELLLYSYIIYDLKRGVFTYEKPVGLERKLLCTDKIKSYLLVGRLHSLIDDARTFETLSNAFIDYGISFGCIKYDHKNYLKCSVKYQPL